MNRAIVAVLLVLAVAACSPTTVNTGTVSNASGSAAPVQAASSQPMPTWGKRYTWSDGLAVEVAQPKSCAPSKHAFPDGVKRAVVVTITIFNGSNKPFEATGLSIGIDAQFAGHKAEDVGDSGGPCESTSLPSGTVLPGKTFTFTAAYAVDPGPGELQLGLQPGFGADKAIFVGQA